MRTQLAEGPEGLTRQLSEDYSDESRSDSRRPKFARFFGFLGAQRLACSCSSRSPIAFVTLAPRVPLKYAAIVGWLHCRRLASSCCVSPVPMRSDVSFLVSMWTIITYVLWQFNTFVMSKVNTIVI